MKKILTFFKNWFEKNGLLKILAAFLILIISTLVVRKCLNSEIVNVFTWIGVISGGYLILTVIVFIIVAAVNSIKDIQNK